MANKKRGNHLNFTKKRKLTNIKEDADARDADLENKRLKISSSTAPMMPAPPERSSPLSASSTRRSSRSVSSSNNSIVSKASRSPVKSERTSSPLSAISQKSKAISKIQEVVNYNNCMRDKVEEYIRLKTVRVSLTRLSDDELPLSVIRQANNRSAIMLQVPDLSAELARASKFFGERCLTVERSQIHGYGLFTKNPIRAGEMIVEYAGDVIDSQLALDRQNAYTDRGIDIYVMQVEKNIHIDATLTGNCARFVNHSCQPNCAAQIISIQRQKRVLIIALRDIEAGDELTYDYHFNADELVRCNCGSRKCRIVLNHNFGRLKMKPSALINLLKEQEAASNAENADAQEEDEGEDTDNSDTEEKNNQQEEEIADSSSSTVEMPCTSVAATL